MAIPSRAEIEILKVPPSHVEAMWPHVSPLISKGLEAATDCNQVSVIADLRSGTDGLWIIKQGATLHAAVMTRFYEDVETGENFLSIFGTGGAGSWRWGRRLNDHLTAYAASHGCKAVRCCGRKALARFLPEWRIVGETMGENIYERALQ